MPKKEPLYPHVPKSRKEHHSNPLSTRVGYVLSSHDIFYITSKLITRGELAALAASYNRIDEVYDVIAEHPGISFPGIWESVRGITLGNCETAVYELQQRGYVRKEAAHHSSPATVSEVGKFKVGDRVTAKNIPIPGTIKAEGVTPFTVQVRWDDGKWEWYDEKDLTKEV